MKSLIENPSSPNTVQQQIGLDWGLCGLLNLRIEVYRWAASRVENAFFNDLFRSLQAQDFVFKAQLQAELGRSGGNIALPAAAAQWQAMVANVSLPPSQLSLAVFFEFIVHLHELETQATTAFLQTINENSAWAQTLRTRQAAGKLLAGSLEFLEQFDEVFS